MIVKMPRSRAGRGTRRIRYVQPAAGAPQGVQSLPNELEEADWSEVTQKAMRPEPPGNRIMEPEAKGRTWEA
jgi:hypothetical protein